MNGYEKLRLKIKALEDDKKELEKRVKEYILEEDPQKKREFEGWFYRRGLLFRLYIQPIKPVVLPEQSFL